MPGLTTCQRLFQPFAHQILTPWGQGSLCSGHKVFLAIDILPLEPVGCWLEPEVVGLTVGSMGKHILPPKPVPRWKGTPSSGSSALQKGLPLPLIGIFSSKERVLFCWPVCAAWKNEKLLWLLNWTPESSMPHLEHGSGRQGYVFGVGLIRSKVLYLDTWATY